MIDKVINEFNINNYTYKLGYDEWDNIVYPKIEIYKNDKLLSWSYFHSGTYNEVFVLNAYIPSFNSNSYVKTMKEMFTQLRQYSNIPEYIEKEYEELFLLYKLNNFKI